MIIKVNYSVSDIYIGTTVSAVYIKVVYSGVSGGSGTWGSITGTLSNQTDLQSALDAKFDDPTGTTAQYLRGDGTLATFPTIPVGTVTSVGLTMPSAFGVANSPITSSGTLAVTALGTASQYIRGDGVLATLPTGGSGGSSVSYYLNGGTAASVGTYFQMSTTAVVGTNADFTRTGNGLISQFLTDVGDPNRLQIPAGNWNFEMFFSMSSSGGNTAFYVELLKYDGTTFTSIASSSVIPEEITGGTSIDLYLTSLAIPATTLLVTDRLALRVYIVNNSGGRTATLHTQDSHLCQIITNFAGGVSALNGLTANTQYFATGTSGTDFGISSVSDTHTFNLPTASATNRGALSSADWTTFNGKVSGSGVANQLTYWNGTGSVTGSSGLVYNDTTGAMSLTKNQNAGTTFNLNNSTNGASSFISINLNYSGSQFAIGKYSSTTSAFGIISANDSYLYNTIGGGDIAFVNGTGSGKIKFAAGASSTAQMTLTAAGRLLLGTTTESTFILDAVGGGRFTGGLEEIAGGQIGLRLEGSATNKDIWLSLKNTNASGKDYIFRNQTNGTFSIEQWTGVGSTAIYTATNLYTQIRASSVNFLFGNETNAIPGLWINVSAGSQTLTNATLLKNGNDTILSSNSLLRFYNGTTDTGRVFATTGNWLIQTGGTFTDIASSLFTINSTTKGFLPPRMTTTERNAISSPATGLVVYNTTLNSTDTYDGATWRTDAETITTNRQTASYSLVLADRGKLVEMNSASANTLTIPLNSSIAFPIGSKIDVTQYGAGATTITATGGVTIRSFTSFLKIAGQYAACTLVKIGTDEWYCYGNLIA